MLLMAIHDDYGNDAVVVFNTDYGSSEPLKTLVMLCYVMTSIDRI